MKQISRLSSIKSLTLLVLLLAGCAGVPRPPSSSGLPPDPSAGSLPRPAVLPDSEGGPSAFPAAASRPVPQASVLELTFAGDIMAHTVNYSMKEYARIYDDVRDLLGGDDLTFGNLETPVADYLPLSTYPRFNVHTPYLAAAVEGGFDVFSLANNHSNDQGTKGIEATGAAVASLGPSVFSSGLKKSAADAAEPVLIEIKGWRILFLSVTEILNAHDGAGKLVHYVPPTETARAAFLADLVRMRREHPCDAFVLSLHSNETEYGRTASEAKKAWFRRMAASGVDVVWAHHPHVMQGWESRSLADTGATGGAGDGAVPTGAEGDALLPEAGRVRPVLFMYSMGNFISGQRENPATDNPKGTREYTGDAVLLRVRLSRTGDSPYDGLDVTAVPVTNYTDPAHGVVVRRFDATFVDALPPVLRAYFRKRSELMGAYLPLLPTMPTRVILEP